MAKEKVKKKEKLRKKEQNFNVNILQPFHPAYKGSGDTPQIRIRADFRIVPFLHQQVFVPIPPRDNNLSQSIQLKPKQNPPHRDLPSTSADPKSTNPQKSPSSVKQQPAGSSAPRRSAKANFAKRVTVVETEFRKKALNRKMIVRGGTDGAEIAVLEDNAVVEHYVARSEAESCIGNIYLGRVQNVLPGMEAAFLDIGTSRNAVMYSGEIDWVAAEIGPQPKKIENAISVGDMVLVQAIKDPVSHKGARVTSIVSLPGRYTVYVPGSTTGGISQKLPEAERKRLREILHKIAPGDQGFIVRTAADGAKEEHIKRDIEQLLAEWDKIQKMARERELPGTLYSEPDTLIKIIRDVFNDDFEKIIVQGQPEYSRIRAYVKAVAPNLLPKIEQYKANKSRKEAKNAKAQTKEQTKEHKVKQTKAGHDKSSKKSPTTDLFREYGVHLAVKNALSRVVYLPSGGSLVIDRTEAMTVIDVNTGRFTGTGSNLEETITKNNLEAAEEVVRQLRLRDIGGIIVIDFIDMLHHRNRSLVFNKLLECLEYDRTKHQLSEVTSLGLVQMTRKKIGLGLFESFSAVCSGCMGQGWKIKDNIPYKVDDIKKTLNGASSNVQDSEQYTPATITQEARNALFRIAASTVEKKPPA